MKLIIALAIWMTGAYNNSVVITNGKSLGSGVVVKDGYVLTAYHVYSPELKVNGQPATVATFQPQLDLMLVRASVKGKTRLSEPKLDEKVFCISHGRGIKMLTRGRVVAIKEDKQYFLMDATTLTGASGSGVYDHDGQLIGMVVGGMWDEQGSILTVVVSSHAIKPFLKEGLK